jgi:hypothetical protein
VQEREREGKGANGSDGERGIRERERREVGEDKEKSYMPCK